MEETDKQYRLKNSIVNDKILLLDAVEKEKELSEEQYGTHKEYHTRLSAWYKSVECFLNDIMTGESEIGVEQFRKIVFATNFDMNKIEDLARLRENPLYKRVLGLLAFEQLNVLEEELYDKYANNWEYYELLFDFDNIGNTFTYNGKKIKAVKVMEELGAERDVLLKGVNNLEKIGKLSKDESLKYQELIFHIYEYYESLAVGEQMIIPKFSDRDYKKMEQKVERYHISIEDQFFELIRNNKKEFEIIQKLQQEYYERAHEGNSRTRK